MQQAKGSEVSRWNKRGRQGKYSEGEEGLSDQAKIFLFTSSLTKKGRVFVERISLDVFVRDSAFLESNPALVGERAELCGEERGRRGV